MRILRLSAMLGLVVACSPSREVPAAGLQPVKWEAFAGEIRKGTDGSSILDVELHATIDDNWHVYSLTQSGNGPVPLTVEAIPAPPYQVAEAISGPQPVKSMDREFGFETETYAGKPVFHVPVKFPTGDYSSAKLLKLKVRSQACSDKLCLPARTTTVAIASQAWFPQ